MHVIVVGAGLTGLQSALSLIEKGAEVTLVEALRSPCQGASFSCAGLLGDETPALIAPEAGRLARLRAMKSSDDGLVYSSGTAFRYASFVSALLQNRAPEKTEPRKALLAQLAAASARLMNEQAERCGFELQKSEGLLTRLTKEETAARPNARLVSSDDILRLEPSLYAAEDGGDYEIGNGVTWSVSYYAKQLREFLVNAGAKILSSRPVESVIIENERAVGVQAGGELRADAVLIAAGTGAPALLPEGALGDTALAPITRSLLNVEVNAAARRVRYAVRDTAGRVAAPLDAYLRLTGRWYLGTEEQCPTDDEYKALWAFGLRLFPEIADWSQGRYLSRTVLSTADGLPVAGVTRISSLYVNVAGGMHGADFASAVADAASDAVLGRDNAFGPDLAFSRGI